MNTLILDLGLRWLHILAAVTLAGGAIFWRFAACRANEALPDAARQEVEGAIRSHWSKLVKAASGILLISGLVNFMVIVQRFEFDKGAFPGSKYHMIFGIKFLLSIGVFLLSAMLTGRSAAAERMRGNVRFWLSVNVLLAVAVVCLGGLLKAAPRHPKSAQSLRPVLPIQRASADAASTLTRAPEGE